MAWLELVDPKRARVPRDDVIAISVAGEEQKQALLMLDPEVFFTEPHYDGYPAVVIRLDLVDPELLVVIGDAWRARAPRRCAK